MANIIRKAWEKIWWLTALAGIGAYAFAILLPASSDLLTGGAPDRMIGDNSDLRALVWVYRLITRTLREHPSRLFFGAVYIDEVNAPLGAASWITLIERIIVPILTPFTNDSTIATAVSLTLMVFNGAAMLWCARIFGWRRWLAFALALAWAVNPFTRARASVHTALSGLYYLPLIFGALELLARYRSTDEKPYKRALVAAIAFFFAATAPHYYLVFAVLSIPILALFFIVRARVHGGTQWKKYALAIGSALPTILFIFWNFSHPLPAEFKSKVRSYPDADPKVQINYLNDCGAHPIDYIGGDVKFGNKDTIAARAKVTQYIRSHLDRSNFHERTGGIRWALLALGAAGLFYGWRIKPESDRERREKTLFKLCAIVAAFAFLMSLSPRGIVVYDEQIGPSLFANKLIPNFRVPNRFSTIVHFATLLSVGALLSSRVGKLWFFRNVAIPLLPFVVVAEYLPLNPMMMAPVAPVSKVSEGRPDCGMGIFLPFQTYDYNAYQETRGTTCRLIYPDTEKASSALESFWGRKDYNSEETQERFAKFAQCTGLDWVHFRPYVSPSARDRICSKLGFTKVSDSACRSESIHPVKRTWQECVSR